MWVWFFKLMKLYNKLNIFFASIKVRASTLLEPDDKRKSHQSYTNTIIIFGSTGICIKARWWARIENRPLFLSYHESSIQLWMRKIKLSKPTFY